MQEYKCTLGIDTNTGTVYVHFDKPADAEKFNAVTVIRIKVGKNEQLPLDIITEAAKRDFMIGTPA